MVFLPVGQNNEGQFLIGQLVTDPGRQRMVEPARGRLGLATLRAGLSDWVVCLGWSLFQGKGLAVLVRALLKCGLQKHRVCAFVNQQLSECARSHLPGIVFDGECFWVDVRFGGDIVSVGFGCIIVL